jgi:DNA-binding transcriptional MerR regulator
METILKPHCQKGDFNQLLFTESGYIIFDQIKQLKAQGLNINAIRDYFEQHLAQVCKQEETPTQHIQDIRNPMSTDMSLFNKLFEEKDARLQERAEHQQKIMELEKLSLKEKTEHQKRILELENLSEHLKSQLLYITDGKSPEEYKNVWYQEQLKTISAQLKEQLSNITDGKPPEDFKKQLQQEQLDKQRISWILKEIENLEGIFSVVNYFKRKKLYKELQGLMNKTS